MEFVLYCLDKPDNAEARRRARAPHLRFIMGRPEIFRYGGPLLGPDGQTRGSLIVLDLPDRAALDRYLAEDPYFTSGLFASVTVWPSRQVIPETAPGLLQKELERQLEADAAARG